MGARETYQHWVKVHFDQFTSPKLFNKEGNIGIFAFAAGYWLFFRAVFRFLCQKTVFPFWCSFRFGDISFFSIRFSVFVENIFFFIIQCGVWVFLFCPVWVLVSL